MCVIGVVSGGEFGAEIGGLRAARKLHIKTGGYCRKDHKTEQGPMPWLAKEFGLVECDSPEYSVRTELNVTFSSGTVIFGKDSSGSNLTEQLCKTLGKPHLWLREFETLSAPCHFRLWVERNKIKILNVAGNRESRNPGIEEAVEYFLMEAIPLCR